MTDWIDGWAVSRVNPRFLAWVAVGVGVLFTEMGDTGGGAAWRSHTTIPAATVMLMPVSFAMRPHGTCPHLFPCC